MPYATKIKLCYKGLSGLVSSVDCAAYNYTQLYIVCPPSQNEQCKMYLICGCSKRPPVVYACDDHSEGFTGLAMGFLKWVITMGLFVPQYS